MNSTLEVPAIEKDNKSKIELEFDWHLTNRCNFFCEYCHPHIRRVLNSDFKIEPDADLIVKRFNDLGKTCLVHMSGGEPFLYPNFVEMCIGLTKKHYISINSNLSPHNIPEFAERIPPEKVTIITAAIHQVERERQGKDLEDFISNYKILRKKGFAIKALYIVFPPLIDRFDKDLENLKNAGVDTLISKVFKGAYNGRRYPEGYSSEERAKIVKHSGEYQFNVPYMNGEMSFTGSPCTAGQVSFKINVNGDVQRCASVKGVFGNFYDGTFKPNKEPTPCTANRVLVISQCHRFLINSPIKPADIVDDDD